MPNHTGTVRNRFFMSLEFFYSAGRRFEFLTRLVLMLTACGMFSLASAQVALTIGSGAGAPGSTVNINVNVNTTGTLPASLQWTMSYSTAISSITVSTGAAASAAGKSVSCGVPSGSPSGSLSCLVFGLNATPITNGPPSDVAVVSVTLASGTTSSSTAITMTGAQASSAVGANLPATPATPNTVAGTITINQPPTTVTINTAPSLVGLQIVVDGVTQTAPYTTQWVPGSSHTVKCDVTSRDGRNTVCVCQLERWSRPIAHDNGTGLSNDLYGELHHAISADNRSQPGRNRYDHAKPFSSRQLLR